VGFFLILNSKVQNFLIASESVKIHICIQPYFVHYSWFHIIIKSRRMRWTGHVARMGEKRNVYRLLVGKPEGKKPLG
jgi:hypothetical protein